MKAFLRVVGLCALALVGFAAVSMAQQSSGVSGVVSDNSGGTVSGVTVALDNSKLGLHATTTTNDIGYYQFLRVTPDSGFELTFTKDGFRKFVLSNVILGVGTVETRNVALELGSVTQSVEVQATGEATLNTTDATVGNVISSRSVDDLPFQFRLDAATLMQLQAGVNDAGSITGARSDQGNITLDGLDINDQATGEAFTSTIPVSIDALQEVRTVTAGETADYGRSSGGEISLITRGGSNNWHGNLREYHRNTLFAANNWFNNRDGVKRPALIRNQFGGNLGGPIKKDKLFFFFDYEGLRRAQSEQIERAVPTDALRTGSLAYINSNPGCDGTARLNTAPNCITVLSPSQVASFDPQGVGPNSQLLSFIGSRPYPEPNDPSGGDGVNSEGFRFTAPSHETVNLYTARVDYSLSENNRFFFHGSLAKEGVDDDFNTDIIAFPGDTAPHSRDKFNSYALSVGWTWTPTANIINQASVGLVRTILDFPVTQSPSFPNEFTFGGPISSPFLGSSSQSRNVPVPEFRDGVTWTRGKHTFDFGTDIKFIRQISALKNDFNFVGIGLVGGFNQTLDTPGNTLRPSDLNSDPSAISNWDGAFPFLLGRYSSVFTNFNYDKSGNPFPNGTGKNRDFNYNEYEFYVQDSWKVRSDLTLIFGLRYDLHSVPYEVNGFQSVASVNENTYLADRVKNALAGVSGIGAVPLVSYSLGGAANNAPGYYNPDHKDFGPRIGFAYNPSVRSGVLGSILGDRKTSIRGSASLLHDRIAGGASFGLDQNTFLFDSGANNPFGVPGDPTAALLNDPRFAGLNTFPSNGFFPTAPSVAAPNTPNLDSGGNPVGTINGGFPSFFQFDRNAKNPYAIVLNFGFQRELPGNFLLEAGYVGRLGRRLLAVGDAATITDFKDPASGQFLRAAFGQMQNQFAVGSVAPIPWFENQINQGVATQFGPGVTCADFGFANCTDLTEEIFGNLIAKGDLSDTVGGLASIAGGILEPNVGLPAQTAANGYIGNYASSNYNSLQVTLRKRISNGLQFDFNYTYSHSIDNVSEIANNYVTYTGSGAGLVCDLQHLRVCRSSSDFDARHTINFNYIYDLPIGRGRHFGRNMSRAFDAIVGGWTWSGIIAGRSGYPFSARTGSFPTAFTLDSPALLAGSPSGLKPGIHTDSGGNLQYFADQSAALAALSFPQGGAVGTRNVLQGPGYSQVDMGVIKTFALPWSESQKLKLRWDSFNTFNHPSFNGPASASLNSTGNFGIITSTHSAPRVMQFALRYEF